MRKAKGSGQVLFTLVTGVVLMALTHAVVNNVLALFITPIANSLGVLRSETALMTTFISLASVIGAPFWGWLYGRSQTKRPLLVGLTIFAAAIAGLAFAGSLTQIYVLAFVVGFTFSGIAVMPVTLLILESAPEQSRALFLSIALAGSGLGGMLLNPFINTIIQNQGYQRAFMVLCGLQAALLLPLVALLPIKRRETPTELSIKAPRPAGTAKLELKPFLLLFLACSCTSLISLGVLLNFPGYLTLCGYPAATISLMTALGSGALMAGKVLLGLLYDRLGLRWATLIVCLATILGLLSLMILPSTTGLVGYVLFFGFGASIGTVTPSYLAANFFRENKSQALGGLQVGQGIGSALGIPLVARLFEVVQPFQLAWLALVIIAVLMTVGLLASIRVYQARQALSEAA